MQTWKLKLVNFVCKPCIMWKNTSTDVGTRHLKSEWSNQKASAVEATFSMWQNVGCALPVHSLSSPCIAEGGLTVVLGCYTVRDKLCVYVCAPLSVCNLSEPRETINSSQSEGHLRPDRDTDTHTNGIMRMPWLMCTAPLVTGVTCNYSPFLLFPSSAILSASFTPLIYLSTYPF